MLSVIQNFTGSEGARFHRQDVLAKASASTGKTDTHKASIDKTEVQASIGKTEAQCPSTRQGRGFHGKTRAQTSIKHTFHRQDRRANFHRQGGSISFHRQDKRKVESIGKAVSSANFHRQDSASFRRQDSSASFHLPPAKQDQGASFHQRQAVG